MRWLSFVGLCCALPLATAAGGDKVRPAVLADTKWIEGNWLLPPQKVDHNGKTVTAIPGFRFTFNHLPGRWDEPGEPKGQIVFSLDNLEGKFLEVGLQSSWDFELGEKKGERIVLLKEIFGEKRELAGTYKIDGKELHLKLAGPVKIKRPFAPETVEVNFTAP